MSVTIKDIALATNVSRGTVDRILNNRGKVKPETAEHIRKMAESMGYVPNEAAKALSTLKKKMVFGVLLPSIENQFFDDLILGIKDAQAELECYDVKIILKETQGYDTQTQLKLIDELLNEGMTAFAFLPVSDTYIAQKIDELVGMDIPVVTINSDIENTKRNCFVGIDFFQNGSLAAGLMGIINDCANVLVVAGSDKLLSHRQRLAGFMHVLNNRFPNICVVDTVRSEDNNYVSYDVVSKSLQEHPEINAVFVAAGGIKGTCEAVARYAKETTKVICFDNVQSTKRLFEEGKITATVCQQPYEQGKAAIKYLFQYFAGTVEANGKAILLDSVIKIRENIW